VGKRILRTEVITRLTEAILDATPGEDPKRIKERVGAKFDYHFKRKWLLGFRESIDLEVLVPWVREWYPEIQSPWRIPRSVTFRIPLEYSNKSLEQLYDESLNERALLQSLLKKTEDRLKSCEEKLKVVTAERDELKAYQDDIREQAKRRQREARSRAKNGEN
jgi:hypothetical protein